MANFLTSAHAELGIHLQKHLGSFSEQAQMPVAAEIETGLVEHSTMCGKLDYHVPKT